mmetsp:Transcript_31003/g.86855  ORF Transcript_31003/g.86855 Transcript_31003/m.86855 type:complete len:301 (+) Transcript_31003:999-1901(+)
MPHSRYATLSNTANWMDRAMKSPPSGSFVSSCSAGSDSRQASVPQVPTATREDAMPSCVEAAPSTNARGVQSRQDTSLSICSVRASCNLPALTSRYTTVLPLWDSTIWGPLPQARLMDAPSGGLQESTPMPPCTRARFLGVTCTRRSPPALPQYTVRLPWSKPPTSTSPNSSSSMAKARVSPEKDTTRYWSNAASAESIRFHIPVMPCRSTSASSLIPMPLRTTRRLPEAPMPLQATTWPCPWCFRSTTQRSTIGLRLVKLCTTSTAPWPPPPAASWPGCSRTIWLLSVPDPRYTYPLSR